MNINLIRNWVARGEDDRLEFKLKANHPEKIVRELVAFANTRGGNLLVGVSDDQKIIGLKYPEEAAYQIDNALQKFCQPVITYEKSFVNTYDGRTLLVYHIPKSDNRPHRAKSTSGEFKAYFRVGEHSIQASRELCTILKWSDTPRDSVFSYGEVEHKLMQILDREPNVTVDSFATRAGISRKIASRILIRMVLAKVIRIHPNDTADTFSAIPALTEAPATTYAYDTHRRY